MRNILACLALSLCVGFSTLHAQSPETILDSINAGRKPEKLFTHFDRSFYAPGETMWYKTYIVVDGKPATTSTVIKAELVDENGKSLGSQILPVTLGTASGQLDIPAGTKYGSYIFRVVTQQMINTGSLEDHYYKIIPVTKTAPNNSAIKSSSANLKFFIEGGSFLTGETNVLAFVATDQLGRPVELKGMIRDSKGKEVAPFFTEQNGMGKFEIIPKPGEQYVAAYADPSGNSQTVSLPQSVELGTNLVVVDEIEKKRLVLSSRFSDRKQQPAYILGEMDQVVIFKIDVSKNDGRFMGRVPMEGLPGGLLHIAVFNNDHQVLAERTCFVRKPNEIIIPEIKKDQVSLSKRAENILGFRLPDSMEGIFSIAVTDASNTSMTAGSPDNIISSTLITSQLKSLDCYNFLNTGPVTGEYRNDAVDLILLTHEYKWNWAQLKKLAAAKLPAANEDFIPLYGRATLDRNNSPVVSSQLHFIIQTKDSATNFFTAETDENGFFSVEGLSYEDSATIFVKNNSEKEKDKKIKIEIQSPSVSQKYLMNNISVAGLIPLCMKWNDVQLDHPVAAEPSIGFDTTGKVLEEVLVQSKPRSATELLEKRHVSGMFSTSARTTIDLINNKPPVGQQNVFDYLRGRSSLMVTGTPPNYGLVMRQQRTLMSGAYLPMALFLDEFQTDASMLMTIPMSEIALIRIYSPGFISPTGALAVYTKKGNERQTTSQYSNTINFTNPGFSPVKLFYAPDYNVLKKGAVTYDNRKTLYWDGALTYIPEDGILPITFFNSDQSAGYKIIVQGFTVDGKLVYWESEVK